jgi:hypothetical protein
MFFTPFECFYACATLPEHTDFFNSLTQPGLQNQLQMHQYPKVVFNIKSDSVAQASSPLNESEIPFALLV